MSVQTSSLNDLAVEEYDDDYNYEAETVVAEEEEEIDDPFMRMTGTRRQSSNMSFRFNASPMIKESKTLGGAEDMSLTRKDSVEDTGNLSGDDEEEAAEVSSFTRGRSDTVQDLRTQKSDIAPKIAMSAVMETIKKGDFMARLEAQEKGNETEAQSGVHRSKQHEERPPSVVTFRTTVAKRFGRSARQLDVDLEGRVIAQFQGKEKKVVHCHKFVTFAPTDTNPCDVACSVKDENGVRNKSWRFESAEVATRFCNLIAMINTSGPLLLEVFNSMDRTKKGYLNVLDLAYALKSIGQPVEEKEVRTMMMLANTVATVQNKTNSLSVPRSAHGWTPPGAKAGSQMGMTIDFTTFFQLFAHSGQPILSLEDCLIEWQSKFQTLNSSAKSVTATTAVAQLENKMDFPALLGGEEVLSISGKQGSIDEISGLRYNVGGPNAMPALAGKMRLTNYRIVLKTLKGNRGARHRMPEAFEELHIPYGTIAKIEEQNTPAAHIVIWCKDLRIVCIAFNPKQPQLVQKIIKAISARCFIGGPKKEICFMYKFKLNYNPSLVPNGWMLYDPQAEFERQGALKTHDGSEPRFFMIDNTSFKHSPTYPARFCVPLHLTKTEFRDAAKFRSKKRLPALTWRCPTTNACLTRSAQPMSGFTGSRSSADERLMDLYRLHGNPDMAPDQAQLQALYLLDCRAMIAATGNSLQGKGTENAKNYSNASLHYCNIGNIHTMRNSLNALTELITPVAATGKARQLIESRFLSNLEETKWLEHCRLCLEASVMVAEKLQLEGASVLVHCSDGWDRTAQVCCLAQLLLDPFYRTIRGLAILIEKDWCAFGYKFGQRCGHFKNKETQERSPIFLQFLDCLQQVLKQYPDVFQYDDRLLVFLADHAFSGLFGTFIGDNERERTKDFEAPETTVSIWTYVLSQTDRFMNKRYKASTEPVWPSTSMKKLQLWSRYYSRWDPEVHPRYDKNSELSWHDDWGTNENHWRTTKKIPINLNPALPISGRMSMTSKPPPPPLNSQANIRHSFSSAYAPPPPPFYPPGSTNIPPPTATPPVFTPPAPPAPATSAQRAPLVRTGSSLFRQVTPDASDI